MFFKRLIHLCKILYSVSWNLSFLCSAFGFSQSSIFRGWYPDYVWSGRLCICVCVCLCSSHKNHHRYPMMNFVQFTLKRGPSGYSANNVRSCIEACIVYQVTFIFAKREPFTISFLLCTKYPSDTKVLTP